MTIEEQLKDILENAFDCKELIVENQSHLHEGHANSPNSGQSHFHIKIVSDAFANCTKVQSHRMINQSVAELFNQGLHALSITILNPET